MNGNKIRMSQTTIYKTKNQKIYLPRTALNAIIVIFSHFNVKKFEEKRTQSAKFSHFLRKTSKFKFSSKNLGVNFEKNIVDKPKEKTSTPINQKMFDIGMMKIRL